MIEHRPVREKNVSIVFIEQEEQFSFPSSILDKSHTIYCEDRDAGSADSYFFHSYYLLPPFKYNWWPRLF